MVGLVHCNYVLVFDRALWLSEQLVNLSCLRLLIDILSFTYCGRMPIINQQTIKEGFKQMQAAVYESYGPPEVVHLCEVSIPVCKDDHVLVQIGASSVNSADVRTRALDVAGPLKVILRLVMGWKRPKQPILGTVFSGKVIAVGSLATDFQVGDRLFGCTPGLGFGCHAEYVAVPIKAAMAKCPIHASDAQSVSLVFGGTTALFFLNKASSKIGSTLLVYGASGGWAAWQYKLPNVWVSV